MATYHIPVMSKFAWQMPVEDRVTVPAGGETKGHRYLVIATASGDFSGHENDIAYYDGASWQFWTPAEGWTVWVKDEDTEYVFDGASWSASDVSAVQSQVLVLESEMSQVQSDLLVEKSTVNDVSEAVSQVQSDLLVEKSTVNDVSEAVSQVQSDLLVEKSTVNDVSEALSQTNSDLLVEKSTVNDVSEAVSQTDSRVLVLESEMSQAFSQIDTKQSEGSYVAEYSTIEFVI